MAESSAVLALARQVRVEAEITRDLLREIAPERRSPPDLIIDRGLLGYAREIADSLPGASVRVILADGTRGVGRVEHADDGRVVVRWVESDEQRAARRTREARAAGYDPED